MVPIHESDVAENRWKESEWNAYELWEAVEIRERHRRLWLVAFCAVIALVILALPIYQEQLPKWRGLRFARILSDRLLDIRKDAAHAQKRFFVKIGQDSEGRIHGDVFDAATEQDCVQQAQSNSAPIFSFPVIDEGQKEISLVTFSDSERLGLRGVVESVCFDPFRESDGESKTFAFIPVKDLTDYRQDRISTVTVLDAASFSFD